MKQFSVKKCGKYIDLTYIGYKSPNTHFDVFTQKNLFFSNRKEVEIFIDYVNRLIPLLEKYSKFNPKLLVLTYLKSIDGVSSGFDVRSKWTIEEVAERIADSYQEKYDKAVKYNKETDEFIKRHKVSYTSQWKKFDKYNDNIDTFQLKGTKITDDDDRLGQDSLERLVELSNELLEKLIEHNKNKKE
jgi:hypothetical protein